MATTITRETLDQQINRNRILSLILLLVVVAGFMAAAYYYNQAKENYRALQETKGVVVEKDQELGLKNQLLAEQKKTLEAVQLLKVFLDDNNEDKNYTTTDILDHLSELAKEKTDEIEKRNAARKSEIKKLFNNSDATRKAAQNTILRKYGNDKKIVSDLLHYAMDNRVNQTYSGSISRIFEILPVLSSAALIDNKKLINEFIQAVKDANLAGPKVTGEIAQIRNKMRV